MAIAGYDTYSGTGGNNNSFLCWCAGVHAPTLQAYPTEYNKYNTLGGVLLATFVLAALSSGYAFYTIFADWRWAAGFGILWGMIIFNFDRFMVATIRKYGVPAGMQWRVLIPRIILAMLIGITIARPLELKLFEKEINVKVAANLNAKMKNFNAQQDSLFQTATVAAAKERDVLALQRLTLTDTLLKLQTAYMQEADGTAGSGRRGFESITRLKMDAYEQTNRQFAPAFGRIDSLLAQHDAFLRSASDSLQQNKQSFAATAKSSIGFLERNKALSDLSNEEDSVSRANMLISLLIILLEIAPILAKMLLPVGPYDIALAKAELVPMGELEKELQTAQDGIRNQAGLSAV